MIENWARDFPRPYLDVVRSSDLSTISWTSLKFRYPWDVVLGTLSMENVTVVGDAMHPTTPDLGQGGGITLEDAVVLARHIGSSIGHDGKLGSAADVALALKGYVGERRWRAALIITASFVSGWIQQEGSVWWKRFLRDTFYKIMMSRVISVTYYDCGRLPDKA